MNTQAAVSTVVITQEQMLEHWQGHRRLTRRVIEAFPDEQLFNYSIGGMRPFAVLAMEMVNIAWHSVIGFATGKWPQYEQPQIPTTKEALLKKWDEVTEKINEMWPQISPERFQEIDKAFGEYEGPVFSSLLYAIDNENHHRGQGYVYLRSLGIEPPYFWER